jgi:DNA-binding NtrC family response regulator
MSRLPTIVFVDDEERILRSLRMLFRGKAEILSTTRGVDVIAWVRERTVDVVVSDQRMPGMSGVEVLREVARYSPTTMRILLTGYADMDAVTASVNEGEIYRFVEKPWDGEKLIASVMRAAAIAAQERDAPAAASVAPRVSPKLRAAAHALVLDGGFDVFNLVRSIVPESIQVSVAGDVESAHAELVQQEFAVIVAVLSNDNCDLIDAVKRLKRVRPATLVIAISPLQDSRLTIGLINEGQVFRFLLAPPGRELLRRGLISALERHAQLRDMPQLLSRHEVDESRPSSNSLPGRLLDYWRRLREASVRP